MNKYSRFKDYMRHSFIQYAIILISFVFILFITSMIINFKLSSIQTNKSGNRKVSDFFEQQYDIYYENTKKLSQNKIIKDFIGSGKNRKEAFTLLYNFSNGQDIKSNFIIFDADKNIKATNLYESNTLISANSTEIRDIINRINEEKDEVLATINKTQYDNGQRSDYAFAKCIVDKDGIIGYLMLQLRDSDINNFVINTDADIISINDRFDNVIYSNNNNLIDSAGKFNPDINSNNITKLNEKSYYTNINNKLPNNIRIITMSSIAVQQQMLIFGVIIICIIGFFVIILVSFLANKMTNKNINAIDTLLEAIDKCASENLEYRISLDTFEEFKILYNKFNNMITKVQYLIDKNKEISERKRIMEIKHLEGQLNPHFVFNVLETLRYEILLNPEEASKMLVSFAKLMRYSINYGSSEVELQTDIEYVNNYLMLQKIRYNNRLEYYIHVDKKLMLCKIPKLIIQPIVENSLVHGMKDSAQLIINVRGEIVENRIEISIEDNGKGIQRNDMEKLLNILNDEYAMPEHIGLYNVNRAIKLMYGEDYGLNIYSKYDSGTKIILKIPIIAGDSDV
ncbi:sensor histidine kinase [Clostridium sp. BSD9I1]|uniref:sensor histidine kinase n=1 Tax=Clostridium sp. BSD9I1 TaxID=2003589 RepID=UPI0016496E2B|nr:histidine kinase [Clostridium sp. BSD9I1]